MSALTEHCDVLIIGAGPAGMAAAVAAAPSGALIVVVDDNPVPGGQIWRDGPGAHLPAAAGTWRDAVSRCTNLRICSATRIVAATAPNELLLEDAQRGWRLQWKKLILCTGARELLLPFPGWTLPGVTGAGALQALIKAGLPVAGERIVVAGSGPLLLAAAAAARQAGAQVVRIAEQASFAAVAGFALRLAGWPGRVAQALPLVDRQYRTAALVVAALGSGRVSAARIQRNGRQTDMACERIACGFGLVPNTELGRALGCTLASVPGGMQVLAVDGMQQCSVADIYAAGECTGIGGSERALVQGAIAGHAAVGHTAAAQARGPERARWNAFAAQLQRSFALGPALKRLPAPDTLVCRCEDVPLAALVGPHAPHCVSSLPPERSQQAARLREARTSPRWRPGAGLALYTGWTEAKLHSRCGMGACQGRVCGAAAQFLFGWPTPEPRPPFSPARIATLAGISHPDAEG